MANQGRVTNAANEAYDSGDEEVISKKKGKRNKKGGQQQEDEFLESDSRPQVLAHKDQDGESADEQDIQNQLEDHFEGVGKKNTRKKKNKGQNNAADLMAAAFDEGADSDEVHAKKGGKKEKKDKRDHQGKKKNKNKNHDSDDEAQQEESKIPEDEEETKEQPEPSSSGLPLEVIYCKSKLEFIVFISLLFLVLGCGLPPEYCSFG